MPQQTQGAAAALYRTLNLDLASYLIASSRLALDHVAPRSNHSEFFFKDPENKGADIAAEYIVKDLKVSAKLLCAARAQLLAAMKETRREAGHGNG